MRVLFFGSGSPASVAALEAIGRCASITGVVVPVNGGEPLRAAAQDRRLPVHRFDPRRQEDLEQQLVERPELIGIGTFPSLLRPGVLQLATRGAINVHWSLLPKHRGPDPLFWTYLDDDRTTGVTLHWVDEGADTGPILLQRAIPLARGRSVVDLYGELARIGAELFTEGIGLIAEGVAPRIAQNEQLATRDPSRNARTWRIDFETWPAERVWHVLRGLGTGLLREAAGPARGYKIDAHGRVPGTLERGRLFCSDGYVEIDPPPRLAWLRRAVSRLQRLTS